MEVMRCSKLIVQLSVKKITVSDFSVRSLFYCHLVYAFKTDSREMTEKEENKKETCPTHLWTFRT